MIRYIFLLTFLTTNFLSNAQSAHFPSSFIGNWQGELEWYKNGKTEPQKVKMELRIQSTDTKGRFTWNIIYGAATEDNRPYTLISKDSSGIHWVIDENNGIVLDQYWIGNKFSGVFTVMGNTIVNSYWIEGDKLYAEFYSYAAKPVATTGKGTDESPAVDSYKVGSYQSAVLKRK